MSHLGGGKVIGKAHCAVVEETTADGLLTLLDRGHWHEPIP